MSRTKALLSTVALCGLMALPTTAQAGEIKLGMTTWVGYGEIFLAKELGYFEEAGLTVDPQIIEEAALTMAGMAMTVSKHSLNRITARQNQEKRRIVRS